VPEEDDVDVPFVFETLLLIDDDKEADIPWVTPVVFPVAYDMDSFACGDIVE